MSKHSIDWHQSCVNNATVSINREEAYALSLLERVKTSRADYAFRQQQIEEATRRGMTEFDHERLLKKVARKA